MIAIPARKLCHSDQSKAGRINDEAIRMLQHRPIIFATPAIDRSTATKLGESYIISIM
jgi:hypothetical protein